MSDFKTFASRFEYVLKSLKVKKLTLAQKLEVSHTTIANIINESNSPSVDKIAKISTMYPQINIDWLITGRGSMYLSETQTGNPNVEEATETYSTAMTNLREEIQYLKELNTTLSKMNKLYEEKINQLEQQLHNGQLPDRKKNAG